MKKLLVFFLAVLLAFPAVADEYKPDNIAIKDFYVSYIGGDFYILQFFSAGSSSGQVSICKLKNELHDGPTPVYFVQDAYFETSGSDVIIKEKRAASDIFASGTAGNGFLDLTLDNENYYHFISMPHDNKVESRTDLFADVRHLFDDGFTVPAGLYIVGEDLPSGVFSFTSSTGCKITVQQNNYNLFKFDLAKNGSFNRYELIDHQYLLVSDGSVTIKTYTGLFH